MSNAALDIRGYLLSKGLNLKNAPGGECHTPCFYCGEASSKGRLYINCDPSADIPGLHYCHLCGERGAFNKILRHFGDYVEQKETPQDEYVRHAILQAAAAYYHERLTDPDNPAASGAATWLVRDRGLEPETIAQHQLGYADGGLRRHLRELGFSIAQMQFTGLVDSAGRDFFDGQVTIPYHTAGNVVLVRGKEIGGKYLTPPGQKARLFNSTVAWDADELFITEGEFDALVMTQLGFKCVGVPGANTWQDTWTGYTEEAKRVYIVFDTDDAGNVGAQRLTQILGPKARIVKMPPPGVDGKKNDPSEWFVNKNKTREDFEILLKKSAGSLLLTVDDCYATWEDVQSQEGLKFNMEALDTLIEPGLLKGQVFIVLAKTGTGKSIFLMNAFDRILQQDRDKKILFISLEQTGHEWYERARRIRRFYDLNDSGKCGICKGTVAYEHHGHDPSTLDFYRENLFVVDKNQLTLDKLHGILDLFEYEIGQPPDLLAIDYLGYWARAFPGERYERTSEAVMALKELAKDRDIPIITPHQVSRTADFGAEFEADMGRDSGVVEETADFMMMLWTPDAIKGKDQANRTGMVKLKVGKSRHGNKGKEMDFRFAPTSLAMVPLVGTPQAMEARARDEVKWNATGANYASCLYMHITGDTSIL